MATKELNYKSPTGKYTIKFQGETKELIEQIAEFQAIFENDEVCGACSSDEIYFNVRDVDGNKYYEKKCRRCTAAKTFHQNKKGGGLYFSWKDKWEKWQPKANDGEEEFDTPAPKSSKNGNKK